MTRMFHKLAGRMEPSFRCGRCGTWWYGTDGIRSSADYLEVAAAMLQPTPDNNINNKQQIFSGTPCAELVIVIM